MEKPRKQCLKCLSQFKAAFPSLLLILLCKKPKIDFLLNALHQDAMLQGRIFGKFGVDGFPVWGTPEEVLSHHGLDGNSVAHAILKKQRANVSEKHAHAGSPAKNG